jgi:hypothetical protein
MSAGARRLLSNLRHTWALEYDVALANLDELESTLRETAQGVINHFRACTEDAARELGDARAMCNNLNTPLDMVKAAVGDHLSKWGQIPR